MERANECDMDRLVQINSAWKQMSTSPKMLKFSFEPYNCMDFVCSAFAKQAATSYCSVACMTLGGGMQL